LKTIRKKIAQKLAKTRFGMEALKEKADLSAFKQHPSFRVAVGIFLMGFSYILAWPCISVLGFIAYKFDRPLLIIIGGPILYITSHLVFLVGLYFAGANYAKIFMKWAVRRIIEKYSEDEDSL
jgi:hypothetical protein